jgi:hypothetical protein
MRPVCGTQNIRDQSLVLAVCQAGACHWLVNFELCLAQLTLPKRRWRIITSDEHSTVWDGRDTLFEFNFLALKVSPDDCFRMAYSDEGEPGD